MQLGQRTFTAVIGMIGLIVAVLMGQSAGTFPQLPDGTIFNPDYLGNLLGQILAPLGLLAVLVRQMFDAVNARVKDGTIDPGDLLQLASTREFVVYAIGLMATVLQIAGFEFEIFNEANQAVLVNSITAFSGLLLSTFAKRESGQSTGYATTPDTSVG